MAFDGTLARVEGGVLVGLFILYLVYSFWEQKRRPRAETEEEAPSRSLWIVALLFAGGLAGVVISSHFIVEATPVVAMALGLPDVVIGLVVVPWALRYPRSPPALSPPARAKGLWRVGNILGADILNICWIAGASGPS